MTTAGGRLPSPPASSAWPTRAALLLPVVVMVGLVARFAVDVPYWDTWAWLDRHYPAPGADAASWWARYWAPFNGHRVFLSLVLDRLLLEATALHILPRIYLKLVLAVATLWLAWRLLRRGRVRQPGAAVALLVACLTLPLTYWPMWIDPRQFSLHLAVLAVLGAVAIATGPRQPAGRTLAAALLCTVATLAYGPGLLAWPFVGLALWWRGGRPPAWTLVAVAAAALGLTASQIGDLRAGAAAAGMGAAGILEALDGALAVIGLPVAPALRDLGYLPTRLAGALGLGAWVVQVGGAWRRHDREVRIAVAPWAALGGWAIAYALAVGAARGGQPLGALHDPRFALVPAMLWMANAAMFGALTMQGAAPSRSGPGDMRRRFGRLAIVVLLVSYATASARPFVAPGGVGRLSVQLERGRACLLGDRADDSCLALLHPSPAYVRVLARRLDARGAAFLRPRHQQAGNAEAGQHAPMEHGEADQPPH